MTNITVVAGVNEKTKKEFWFNTAVGEWLTINEEFHVPDEEIDKVAMYAKRYGFDQVFVKKIQITETSVVEYSMFDAVDRMYDQLTPEAKKYLAYKITGNVDY